MLQSAVLSSQQQPCRVSEGLVASSQGVYGVSWGPLVVKEFMGILHSFHTGLRIPSGAISVRVFCPTP